MIVLDKLIMVMVIVTTLLIIVTIFMMLFFVSPFVISFLKSKKTIIKRILIIGIPLSAILIFSVSYYRVYYENQTHEIYIKLEELEKEKKELMNFLAKGINDEVWIQATSLENDVGFLFCKPTYLIQEANKYDDNLLNVYSYRLKKIEDLLSEYLKKFVYAYERCPELEHTDDEYATFSWCELFNITN